MEIKVDNIAFNSFKDGICDIYTTDELGNKAYKYKSLGFDNRVLGFKRAFSAKAVQTQVNAVIRIPQVSGVDVHDIIEIKGKGKYSIELTQDIFSTNPYTKDLTLKQLEVFQTVQ